MAATIAATLSLSVLLAAKNGAAECHPPPGATGALDDGCALRNPEAEEEDVSLIRSRHVQNEMIRECQPAQTFTSGECVGSGQLQRVGSGTTPEECELLCETVTEDINTGNPILPGPGCCDRGSTGSCFFTLGGTITNTGGTIQAILCVEKTPEMVGDPHALNLAGRRFDVNQPGWHTLLRIPSDEATPALLQLDGELQADNENPCSQYLREAVVSGEWFKGTEMSVRSRKHEAPGSTTSGKPTVLPFSFRLHGSSHTGTWMPVSDLFAVGNTSLELSPNILVVATGSGDYVGDELEVQVSSSGSEYAHIRIQQGSHESLNIRAGNLHSLGIQEVGGLLGSDGPSRDVELQTEACSAFVAARAGGALRMPAAAAAQPTLAASWE